MIGSETLPHPATPCEQHRSTNGEEPGGLALWTRRNCASPAAAITARGGSRGRRRQAGIGDNLSIGAFHLRQDVLAGSRAPTIGVRGALDIVVPGAPARAVECVAIRVARGNVKALQGEARQFFDAGTDLDLTAIEDTTADGPGRERQQERPRVCAFNLGIILAPHGLEVGLRQTADRAVHGLTPHNRRGWIEGDAVIRTGDLLARIILAPQELPVGVITALAGAPFFLWVLRRSQAAKMRE